jgi:hypothetical protein
MKRSFRVLFVCGFATAALLGLASFGRKAKAEGQMYIEICTTADCTPDGLKPPPSSAYFSAGTAKHDTFLWLGVWDATKKKWVGNSLLFQADYINDQLIQSYFQCGKTLEFHSCDKGSFDCSRWNGRSNVFVSPGDKVKIPCQ